MTDKELKSLNRTELLEMLLASSRENQLLQERLEEVSRKLESREIAIRESGSIAEAALKLNGIFEAAEASVQQYIDNVKKQEAASASLQKEAEERAKDILLSAKQEAAAIEAQAQKNSEQYWLDVSERVDKLLASHEGLKEKMDKFGK